MGFEAVACGPLVRSSYRAGLLFDESEGAEPVVTRDSTGSAISSLQIHRPTMDKEGLAT